MEPNVVINALAKGIAIMLAVFRQIYDQWRELYSQVIYPLHLTMRKIGPISEILSTSNHYIKPTKYSDKNSILKITNNHKLIMGDY